MGRGGCMMVCGGTAMGVAVQECVVQCVRSRGADEARSGDGPEWATKWMEGLIETGRYVQELWS